MDIVSVTLLLVAFAAQAVAAGVTFGERRDSRPTSAGRWGGR